jgi:chorismate mutase / prephenate dehydratase
LASGRRKVNADFTFRPAPAYSVDRFAHVLGPMDTTAPPLDHLRAEIDRIDQQILDLLIERSEVVRRIGEVKGDLLDGRSALRPAREAQILRRLAERARGRFPTAVLVRMWRELVAAHTRLQAPLSVAVFARKEDGPRIWDLARDHFGSATPMHQVDRPMQALRALGDGSATVAVLPLPGDDDSWWVSLMSDHDLRLRVFARLPFVAAAGADGDEVRALAIGQLEVEESGEDLTVLAIEAGPGLSRGRLRDLLVAAGLEPGWASTLRQPDSAHALHLVEVESFVGDGDGRITDLRKAAPGEVLRVVSVGGYARPLSPD